MQPGIGITGRLAELKGTRSQIQWPFRCAACGKSESMWFDFEESQTVGDLEQIDVMDSPAR